MEKANVALMSVGAETAVPEVEADAVADVWDAAALCGRPTVVGLTEQNW